MGLKIQSYCKSNSVNYLGGHKCIPNVESGFVEKIKKKVKIGGAIFLIAKSNLLLIIKYQIV